MNLLKRCARSIASPLSLRHHKTLYLRPIVRSSPYSTSYWLISPETSKLTGTLNPQEPSSFSTWSSAVKKQAEESTDFPRPREIPYQAKVANFVNLIGHVKLPVKFQSFSNGKNYAATLICKEHGADCSIPVLFEGDLAHVASCHVKENDCVYVTGKLSVDPMPFVVHEGQGKFHVLAQDICFVEGFEEKGLEFSRKMNVKQAVGRDALPDNVNGNFDGMLRQEASDSVSSKKLEASNFADRHSVQKNVDNVKHSPVNGGQRSGQGLSPTESWEDLVKNPKHWRDCRPDKSMGLLSPKYPDFKHRESGTALWINGAPSWVLPGLDNLDFGVFRKPGIAKNGKEEAWKSLIENPRRWWDNRSCKRNEKAPDFKHKETGEGLWLTSAPDWVDLDNLGMVKDRKEETSKVGIVKDRKEAMW